MSTRSKELAPQFSQFLEDDRFTSYEEILRQITLEIKQDAELQEAIEDTPSGTLLIFSPEPPKSGHRIETEVSITSQGRVLTKKLVPGGRDIVNFQPSLEDVYTYLGHGQQAIATFFQNFEKQKNDLLHNYRAKKIIRSRPVLKQ